MSERGKFMIYCAEQYKLKKNLTGKELESLFTGYDVWNYVYTCYDALHTTGTNYIINDIDGFIAERNAMA